MNVINREGFYEIIFNAILNDMRSKGVDLIALSKKETAYIISRGQYYNIKNISEGKDAPVLSDKRLNELCEYLNIQYQPMYKYEVVTTD